MKRAMLVLGVVGLAACPANNSGGGDDYPIGIGSGGTSGGGSGGTSDGGIDAETGDAGVAIAGRVCLLTDLRMIGVGPCATEDAGNLTVSLGNRTALTADDGKFTIIAPAGGGLVWRVTSDGKMQKTVITPSVMPFGTDATIPAISLADYTNLLGQNSIVAASEQQGSVFVRVVKNGAAAASVTASSSPAAQQGALYDSGNAVTWNSNTAGTGTHGVIWLAGLQLAQSGSSTATIALLPTPTSTPVNVSALVEDEAITFLTVELQ